jgi:4'-phosphopantetheinyl transferase
MEAHVWLVDLDADDLDKAESARLLSADEHDRAWRFTFALDRQRYIASHAALRSVLGSYLHLAPERLQFVRDRAGKPELMPCGARSSVQFNLSHSDGMALIAVTRGRQIGVDVERVRDDFGYVDVARWFFSRAEMAALMALPFNVRRHSFYQCWTAKEALAKARGTGLDGTRNDIDIVWTDTDGLRITSTSPHWRVAALHAGQGYVAAVALQRTGREVRRCFSP